MPSNPEMSKFLYTIVKQLDLKSIDWNQVSSELGITNGHAARMRYSRFKQQMEGNTPVRRARGSNVKRTPKQKRPKDEEKNVPKIKSEEPLSMTDQIQGNNSPSIPTFEAGQESHVPTMSDTIVKLEPRDDPVSPDVSLVATPASFSHQSIPVQAINLPNQVQQPHEVAHTGPPSCESVPDFSFDTSHPQSQHQQRMFQPMMPQMHVMMEQNLTDDMIMAEDRDFEPFLGIDMYNTMPDVSCHGHMLVPMVKVEERWDVSYGQS